MRAGDRIRGACVRRGAVCSAEPVWVSSGASSPIPFHPRPLSHPKATFSAHAKARAHCCRMGGWDRLSQVFAQLPPCTLLSAHLHHPHALLYLLPALTALTPYVGPPTPARPPSLAVGSVGSPPPPAPHPAAVPAGPWGWPLACGCWSSSPSTSTSPRPASSTSGEEGSWAVGRCCRSPCRAQLP